MLIQESTKIWSAIRCRQKINGDSESMLAKQLSVTERTLKQYDKSHGEKIMLEQIDHYCRLNKITLLQLLQSAELLTNAA